MHRVVLVVESPFSARDEARFGVRELESAGFSVEVWDVCALTLPEAGRQWTAPPALSNVHRCVTWSQVEELADGLMPNDAVVLICGVYWRLVDTYRPLLMAVLSSRAVVGTIASGTIPRPRGLVWIRGQAHQAVIDAKTRIRPAYDLPRALDVVWAATSVESIVPVLRPKHQDQCFVHTLDYDRLLRLPAVPEPQEPFVVFVDAMGPHHPDYASLGMENPWSEATYRELIQAAFEAVEDAGTRIVVAAHPRAAPGSLESLYPDRDICHGITPALIQQCAYALTVEGSTSLGMAAVLRKPVLFVEDPAVPQSGRALARRFRAALGASAIQVRLRNGHGPIPSINETRYRDYVQKYVKRAGTPEVPFWDVVAGDLHKRSVV